MEVSNEKKKQMFHLSPIMKVVGGSCNLRCQYCFYDGHQNFPLVLMREEVLEKMVGDLMKVSNAGMILKELIG